MFLQLLWWNEIVSGIVSNVASALVKWLWSLKSTTNIDGRPKLVVGLPEMGNKEKQG